MKNLTLLFFLIVAAQCEISEANRDNVLRGMEFLQHHWVVVPEQRQHEVILEQVRNQNNNQPERKINNVKCHTVLVPSIIDPSIKYEKTVCN